MALQWVANMNDSNPTDLVLLDVYKAFDMVDTLPCLQKLTLYRLSDISFQLSVHI